MRLTFLARARAVHPGGLPFALWGPTRICSGCGACKPPNVDSTALRCPSAALERPRTRQTRWGGHLDPRKRNQGSECPLSVFRDLASWYSGAQHRPTKRLISRAHAQSWQTVAAFSFSWKRIPLPLSPRASSVWDMTRSRAERVAPRRLETVHYGLVSVHRAGWRRSILERE